MVKRCHLSRNGLSFGCIDGEINGRDQVREAIGGDQMNSVLVYVHVKPEFVEQFKAASIENARNSLKEPGIARFDLIQQVDDPTRFILVEVYRTTEAQAAHKETDHYKKWRDTVLEMMEEPRQGIKHQTVFPEDSGW
jgi:(4S)-4-hydroxy-5-phosphonooxypentane-2,3-dione isomerase